METIRSSETSVLIRATRRHLPEDDNHHIRENIKISAKESLGYYELLKLKPWFDDRCSELLHQRKQARLQWLQNPSKINGDNLNNIRHETSRYFRNRKNDYLKGKIDELAKTIRTRTLERGSNLVKDENGDLLADPHNILNRWKNYFSQLLNVHRVSGVRQIEIHIAEPLVPDPSTFEIEIAIANLKRYEPPCSIQILAKLIQAGGEILRSKIHKLIKSISPTMVSPPYRGGGV
jgi:hypothetical protein